PDNATAANHPRAIFIFASVRVSRRTTLDPGRLVPPAPGPLCEPALAPAIVLDVAVALAARRRQSEIEFLDVLVAAQYRRGAVHHDAAVFEDVAVIGMTQRDVGVLLGDEEAD